MEWLSATPVALITVAAFWTPGAAVLWILRVRGIGLAATAPLVTLGLMGAGAIVADWAHVRWYWPTALGVTGLAALTAAGLSRRTDRSIGGADAADVSSMSAPARRALIYGATFGIVAQLLPVAIGMGRPVRLLTAYDAITHFNALAHMRMSGSASSFTFFGVDTLTSRSPSFYPSGWHSVVALLPTWPDASTVFNVAAFVPAAISWTLGLARLTQVTFPSRPRTWAWAAALSATGIGLPVYLVLRPEGMAPNACAVALLPAFVALVVSKHRARPSSWFALLGISAVGLGLTHPNALLSAGLVLAPWATPRIVRVIRRAATSSRDRWVLTAGTVAFVALLAALAAGPTAIVVSYPQEAPVALWEALVRLLSGNLTGMALGTAFMVVATSAIGAVLAWRLPRARWLVLANAVMVVFYLLATSSIPVLKEVDRPWFGEPRRFAPVVAAVLVPLAALAIDAVPRWLITTGRVRTNVPPGRAALGIGLFVLMVSTLAGAVGAEQLAHDTYTPTGPSHTAVADDAELAMMHRLRSEIDADGAVFGSPFSGAAHLYGLNGQAVVMRVPAAGVDPDLIYLRAHIAELGIDPTLCEPLHRLNVRYLYVDSAPWNGFAVDIGLESAPKQGVRLVDSGGTASVYEITACT